MNELHRQVNPNWLKDGRPSSLTFRPTPKDDNKLSVYDGSMMTAEESHKHYTSKYRSAGVVTATCLECATLDLIVASSPIEENPAHAHIDYGTLSGAELKRKSKMLLEAALQRGWTYQPEA